MPAKRADDAELVRRLVAKSMPEPNTGCWLWMADHRDNGYGSIQAGDRKEVSHRLSYRLFVGPIPAGLYVLHRCDQPACINPDHLFLGTQSDNLNDCVRKGRHRPHRAAGEANAKAKLTAAQVAEIRLIPRRMGALAEAAPRYGVTRATLCAIRNGREWKHIP